MEDSATKKDSDENGVSSTVEAAVIQKQQCVLPATLSNAATEVTYTKLRNCLPDISIRRYPSNSKLAKDDEKLKVFS